MPIFKFFGGQSSNESMSDVNENNNSIIETIADAMNDVQINSNSPNNIQIFNNPSNSYNSKITTAAITINGSSNSNRRNIAATQQHSPNTVINSSNKHTINHPNLYYTTNPNGLIFDRINNSNFIIQQQKHHNNDLISNANNNDDVDSNSSSTNSLTSRNNLPSLENIQFQDDS